MPLPPPQWTLTLWNQKANKLFLLSAALVIVFYHSNRKGTDTGVHYVFFKFECPETTFFFFFFFRITALDKQCIYLVPSSLHLLTKSHHSVSHTSASLSISRTSTSSRPQRILTYTNMVVVAWDRVLPVMPQICDSANRQLLCYFLLVRFPIFNQTQDKTFSWLYLLCQLLFHFSAPLWANFLINTRCTFYTECFPSSLTSSSFELSYHLTVTKILTGVLGPL